MVDLEYLVDRFFFGEKEAKVQRALRHLKRFVNKELELMEKKEKKCSCVCCGRELGAGDKCIKHQDC